MNSIVAPNIKTIIKDKCLKQSAVAEKAGYTKQQFNAMLNGRKVIKDVDVLRIATVLCVDANALFEKGSDWVKIGDKEYSEILITDTENNLIASITDKDIIEEENCKVVCVPIKD